MTTTLRDTPPTIGDALGDEPAWTLVVAHHPIAALVGLRRVLLPGAAIELGRDGQALGPDGLNDARLSRRHARVRATDDGGLRVEDLGSSNGTWVNDRHATSAELDVDDVLRVGSIALVAQRAPPGMRVRTQGPLPALAWPMARALDALESAPRGRVVVCWGEADVGVDEVARWLHAREAPGTPWVHLRDAGVEAHVPAEATALLGPVDDLASPALAARVETLRRAARRVIVWAEVDRAEQDAVALPAHPALAAMDPVVVRVPALRERAVDLPRLIELSARRHHGRGVALHHRLVTAMLLAPWPGNLRQLDAIVRDHLRPGDAPLRLDPALSRELGVTQRSADAASAPSGPARFVIDRAGRWFEGPDGRRVAVHPRRALVNVLAALAARVGDAADTAALVAAGWPGERLVGASGATRLYVALSTLRRLGLRDAITREGGGYRLGGPDVVVALA